MGTQDRGFAHMDAAKQKAAASKGGSTSSRAGSQQKMSRSESGKMGNKAESTEAKAEGGRHSHD